MDPKQIRSIHQTWESVHAELDEATQVFAAGITQSMATQWGGDREGVARVALAEFLVSARSLVDQAGQVTAQAKLACTAIEGAYGVGRQN